MKKSTKLSILLFGLVLLNSCEQDYLTPTTTVIDFPVSFSQNIIPIMVEDCAIPTCHVQGGHAPNLTASEAYDQLTGLGYVDTANAEQSLLYVRITGTINPMPPSEKLSSEEIGYILAWIKQGAQNN